MFLMPRKNGSKPDGAGGCLKSRREREFCEKQILLTAGFADSSKMYAKAAGAMEIEHFL
jgi:hypothetical protein